MILKKKQIAVLVGQAFAGVAIAVSVGAVQAQDAQKIERIEITGSSIKRIAAEAALPVQTFNAEEIKKSGVTSVTDFIQQLPVMQGFTASSDSVGGGGGGITSASIHDVGEQYTLVLLNGRRVAPATSGTTIDLNSIPLAAIDRIEVLTDGASALYGADAIAGVVNFILKKGESPFQIDARMTAPQGGGAEGQNVSMSKGIGNLERDGYSLFGAFSYDKSKQLKAADRDFAKTGIINFTDQQGRQLSFFNGSSRSVPPNVDVRYNSATKPAVASGNSSTSLNPYFLINGECPEAHVPSGRQCIFDYTSSVEIMPEIERTGFYASGELKLGSSGFKAFADFALTDAHILARIAPYPAEFRMSKDHPYFATYIQPYLTAEQIANLTSINVKYRLYDMGNRSYDYQTKANHLVAGIDGAAGGWDVNAALTFSNQKQLQNYVAGFPLDDKFNAALNAQLVDPFPYKRGEMPADQLAALKATGWTGAYNTTDIKMFGADARGSRELFKMDGGSAQLGLGVDYRETKYKVAANSEVANAEILFDDPQPEYDLKRSNAGLYAELVMPVTKQLEVTGALRHDSIGGVDNALTGVKAGSTQTSSTYKVSAKYQPAKSMLFRGSYGTGFRAASMLEIAQPQVDFGVTGGTYACPFSGTYDPKGYIAQGVICDDLQKEVFTGGNPALKPEKSTQWSLGTVFEPTANLAVALDYWAVEVKDAVTSVSERMILSDPAKYLSLYTTKHKSSNGLDYVAILLAPVNIGKAQNSGIDWDLTYKDKTQWGKFTGRLAGTHLVRSRYLTPGTTDSWETSLGQWGTNDAVSFKNVIVATASLDTGTFTHSLTMNYRSGYKDIHHDADNCAVDDGVDCIDTQLDVPAYKTFDWQTKWNATKDLSLTAGIQNLLDVDPPLTLRNVGSHQLGYDPRYASALGRTFYVTASYKF